MAKLLTVFAMACWRWNARQEHNDQLLAAAGDRRKMLAEIADKFQATVGGITDSVWPTGIEQLQMLGRDADRHLAETATQEPPHVARVLEESSRAR